VKTPLMYCTEMISVLLFNLAYASKQTGELVNLRTLTSLNVRDEVGLGTMAGFSLASILSQQTGDPSFVSKLIGHTKRFQADLSELSEESVSRLTTFLQDALNAFES
jgi:hypothetical protein